MAHDHYVSPHDMLSAQITLGNCGFNYTLWSIEELSVNNQIHSANVIDYTISYITKSLGICDHIRFAIAGPLSEPIGFATSSGLIAIGHLLHALLTVTSKWIYAYQPIMYRLEFGHPLLDLAEPGKLPRIPRLFKLWTHPTPNLKDDVERRALNLADTALVFSVLHESAHIINGHLRSGVRRPEHSVNLETASENLTRRTLEMDADSFAVQHLFLMLHSGMENGSELTRDLLHTDDVIRRTTMAFLLSTLFMQAVEYERPDPYGDRAHPAALIRFKYTLGVLEKTVAKFVANGGPAPTKATWPIIQETFNIFENALSSCEVQPITETDLDRANALMPEYYGQMSQRWREIRDILVLHKLGRHVLAMPEVLD